MSESCLHQAPDLHSKYNCNILSCSSLTCLAFQHGHVVWSCWIFIKSLLGAKYCYGHWGHKNGYGIVPAVYAFTMSLGVKKNCIIIYNCVQAIPFIHVFNNIWALPMHPSLCQVLAKQWWRNQFWFLSACSWSIQSGCRKQTISMQVNTSLKSNKRAVNEIKKMKE